MSAFKRYQSKVFWNQMHDLDIASNHSNGAKSLPLFEESFESSKDTTDDANVTVIRRDKTVNDIQANELSTANRCETSNEEEKTENISNARAYSPLSQGQRSQDSGFSDSDRSECSNANVRTRERRYRRRGRIRKQRKVELSRINSLCNPTHTSTPKQDCRLMERENSLVRQHADISKTRWDLRQLDCVDESNANVSSIQTNADETIADFLFVEDFPDENSQSSSSWSNSDNSRSSKLSLPEKVAYNFDSSNNRLAPVRAWLCNIAFEEKDECETLLFHKSLPKPKFDENQKIRSLYNFTSSATSAATKLLVRADKFDQHFDRIVKQLSELENVRIERELIQSIEEDAYNFLSLLGAPPSRRIHQGNLQNILHQLNQMKADVEKALEPRLDFYIERVVKGLEDCSNEDKGGVRGTIAAMSALGMAGSRAGRSIARCYGVRNLLALLFSVSNFPSELRCASLRALACICSCPEAIEAFVKDDGAELLADILASRNRPESEKTEAAALIVQISAPWSNALGTPQLALFADSLVRDLTELAERTSCSQTLLLSAAALNYLSSNHKFVQPIFDYDTVRILLNCVKKSAGGNVCLMEQVASLIGELARHPQTFTYLAKSRASVALVSFLRMRPANLEDTYKRLQVTASAALTRMCVDPEIAKQVVALGATDCLPIYEIKDQKTREEEEEEDKNNGFKLRCSKSLRLASKEAAEQIDVAKSVDQFIF